MQILQYLNGESSREPDAKNATPLSPRALSPISERIAPLEARLEAHPLCAAIQNVGDVRIFMQHHIFAVWDFMSLLKSLQRELTCVSLPWVPTAQPKTRRFINAIVLEEESDQVDGETLSHYELYRRAMLEIGADPTPCDRAITRLATTSVARALATLDIPKAASRFVRSTFAFIATGKPHVIAAAFTYGREDPIPDMFRALLGSLSRQGTKLDTLKLYLERHIHLDEGEHGPMAEAMLAELCGNDRERWREASDAAAAAIEARLALWGGVVAAIEDQQDRPRKSKMSRRTKANETAQ
jgi:hypothetical protein